MPERAPKQRARGASSEVFVDRRRILALFGAGTAHLLGRGCYTVPGTREARAPSALPERLVLRYSIPEISDVVLEGAERVGAALRHRGRMVVEERDLEFDFYAPVDRQAPAPFLVNLPILAGAKPINRMVCSRLASRGFASGTLEGPGRLFHERQTLDELNRNLVDAVRVQRAFLGWASERDEVESEDLGAIGVSMGGMVGTVLGAVEPRLKALSICLAGGDYPDVLMHTNEGRANAWGRERVLLDGISMRELQIRAARALRGDPAILARHVDTRKVLFVTAEFDRTMPRRNSDLLWEALGRPERKLVPFEHYTALLAIDWIIGEVAAHSRRRFGRPT